MAPGKGVADDVGVSQVNAPGAWNGARFRLGVAVLTDKRLIPPVDYFVGKCQSCSHSIGTGKPGIMLLCTAGAKDEVTRPNWQCGRFVYEPGSLG